MLGEATWGFINISKNLPFLAEGFGNWIKALERFEMHEKSEMHREALERLKYRASSVHIGNLMNTQVAADQEFHRCMLFKLLWAIRFLAKQGLVFRGHNESSEAFQGNLYQLLLLQAEECPEMNVWLQKREYISPKISNEIIQLMGQTMLKGIVDEVSKDQWYAVIADEASDVSRSEQLSVTVKQNL